MGSWSNTCTVSCPDLGSNGYFRPVPLQNVPGMVNTKSAHCVICRLVRVMLVILLIFILHYINYILCMINILIILIFNCMLLVDDILDGCSTNTGRVENGEVAFSQERVWLLRDHFQVNPFTPFSYLSTSSPLSPRLLTS